MNRQQLDGLREAFGEALQEDVSLGPYTSIRIGGPADVLLEVRSIEELRRACVELWKREIDFRVLGGGSNVLISDAGIRGVVVLNKAREVWFHEDDRGSRVRAGSGAMLGSVARRSAERGLGGLEWAATIPGTVGGAVVGNAGAHGGCMADSLIVAEILQHGDGVESWTADELNYAYRSSRLKTDPGRGVVLSASLKLARSAVETCKRKVQEFAASRERTQPSGASMGSMFKNPTGDYAGRLIDTAGLKGKRFGAAVISEKHGNFFINEGGGTAADMKALIDLARERVAEVHGVQLELEVELVGDWSTAG